MSIKTWYMIRLALVALMAFGITTIDCQANNKDKPKRSKNQKPASAELYASSHSIDMFMGDAHFKHTKMFEGRGGRNILSAQNGNVLIFHKNFVVESTDGGALWSEPIHIGSDVSGYNSIVNEVTGEILLVHAPGYIWKSGDHGKSWKREDIKILPNSMLHGSPDGIPLVLWAMQPGVTLMHGEHKGRLIMASRVWGVDENPRVFPWWMFQYSNALYSDDNGKTWQSSSPFPCVGTGEGALAELTDGSIFYSSRKHYFDPWYPEIFKHELHYAISYDGGENWEDLHLSKDLPDGPRHRSKEPVGMNFNGHYGLLGGLLRLPVEGRDILLYSNVDTPSHKRERMTVWASFDGGKTWPVSRLVYDGPSAYSSLGVGRAGTSSQGKIYLTFEGGEEDAHEGVHLAVFNLSWLLNGQKIDAFLK
ncbi:MAG: exo-alpha-sialidase [Cyclobacteriaceae bacterium]|nr:exo-alpha-sialidase [Cyclobacteriaceae bacterium]